MPVTLETFIEQIDYLTGTAPWSLHQADIEALNTKVMLIR